METIPTKLIANILPALVAFFYAFRLFTLKTNQARGKNFIAYFFVLLIGIDVFGIASDFFRGDFVYYLIAVFLGISFSLAPTIQIAVYKYVNLPIKNILKHYYIAIAMFVIDFVLLSITLNLPKGHAYKPLFVDILFIVNIGGLSVIFIIQNIIYLVKLVRLINSYNKNIGSYFSFEEGVNLKWLKSLIYGYLVFVVLMVATSLFKLNDFFQYTSELITLIFIIYLGSKSIQYQHVMEAYSSISLTDFSENHEEEVDDEIQLNNELDDRLLQIMESEKPYLNPTLTIFELAKKINTNDKYLSRHINRKYNKNFIHFINEYRIEDAKTKLLQPDFSQYKIEAISEMVGFNSKSAFNNAFKKLTNQTPTEFRILNRDLKRA
jgi:AraC-like DNA-binding protein